MCRLFGLTAGTREVAATFWLLDAPDSLSSQSRRDPDGTGLGWFDTDGAPHVEKQPIAAFEDRAFAAEARDRRSSTFVAHVRLASAGGVAMRNTHPFEQAGRLFAHNGGFGGADRLERELGEAMSLVVGETDSERYFALITRETAAAGGDVGEGIRRAVTWIDRELPVIALNFVLVTPGELWALRTPELDTLFVLERPAGGRSSAPLEPGRNRPGTLERPGRCAGGRRGQRADGRGSRLAGDRVRGADPRRPATDRLHHDDPRPPARPPMRFGAGERAERTA